MKNGKKMVRLSNAKVTSMTLWNLRKLAKMANYGDNLGKVIDQLVKEKMVSLKVFSGKEASRQNCVYCYKEFCSANCIDLKDDSMCSQCGHFKQRMN